ncbi:plasmid maintenance system killer protein [Arthrobacter sp. KBS0703]|uniref:plasmid maintenance system killer protein n=1 Tax=Arthrobacter sp. KBS0703 TaxID=1955698 RepID=UPI0011169588|nr:plasmid maintenance system killer protein [Arthrobacter sp. KBS0703]
MKVVYSTKKLLELCTVSKVMNGELPTAQAKALRKRIVDLKAASTVDDLLKGLGKWHALTGRGSATYAAHLSKNWRIVVSFDLGNATAVVAMVESVEDYH